MVREPEGEPCGENPLVSLMHRAAAGDKVAAGELARQVQPVLEREMRRRSRGRPNPQLDVSGVVNELVFRAVNKADQVKATTDGGVRKWLRTMARNAYVSALRVIPKNRVPLPENSSGEVVLTASTPTPSKACMCQEEADQQEQAFSRLLQQHQQVLRLRIHERLDWAEVARQMGRTEAAVRRLFFRAVKRFGKEMKP